MRIVRPADRIYGTIALPGDKSITHRVLILSAAGKGISRLFNLSYSADCLSTCRLLKKLGVSILLKDDNETVVHGVGLMGFKEPKTILHAGNSGTLARLLSGILAGQKFVSIITGDASLMRRPMMRVVEPLRQMGALILGRANGEKLPIAIKGEELQGITYKLPVASAQVKSAILLAGLLAKGKTSVIESVKSRDHTERLLMSLGLPFTSIDLRCEISGGAEWDRFETRIPGDLSSAAPFIVAALLLPGSHLNITDVGLNPIRLQYLEILCRMGGDITWKVEGETMGEPWGTVIVRYSKLKGTAIDNTPGIIDEIPLLALAATQAEGATYISRVNELRVKESNRLSGIIGRLKNFGANITLKNDTLIVHGPVSLIGGDGDAKSDHRMVMWHAVCGLISKNPVAIHGADWVKVSFPSFWELLDKTVERK